MTISIHAPREGGDPCGRCYRSGHRHFNPRPPRGGRRCRPRILKSVLQISIHAPREGGDPSNSGKTAPSESFQSTPPARGATWARGTLKSTPCISIHAPREGGDDTDPASFTVHLISIHAPREGGDHSGSDRCHRTQYFNPRPPRGGRLNVDRSIVSYWEHFNPRPPRGGRPGIWDRHNNTKRFQSTPPARGATERHKNLRM